MLELTKLKKLHDKAYEAGQTTRERASDDMVFYWVTQWDDQLLDSSQLQYRGEFNVLRKAGRQIVADLRSNPVQVDFDPKDETREDAAELADGLYRSSDRDNISIEAYDNAMQEAVVCGVGAWVLYTAYESSLNGDEKQTIKRKPLLEANNNCFWDPNSKHQDKSDARYCSVLWAYTEDGFEELKEDLLGEDGESLDVSFAEPEQSYTFPWIGGSDKKIYVSEFYYRTKVRDTVLTMTDPFGETLTLLESSLTEVMDDLIDEGYEITSEKVIERWECTKYIASGDEILVSEVIPGGNIPVIPTYGERAYIEGEEHYEGITRLAKDPQRLRNFQMSYLADIVSRSPRPKPIFSPEQISGFEFMYEENGADNNYPYYLQNRFDSNGNPLPVGAMAVMPEQTMPNALAASIDLSRQAVEDVANPGVPQDIADADLSGKAAAIMQNRIDQQSMVYQQNMKHAKRRDAEVWAGMASVIMDTPRAVTITKPDGSREQVQMMDVILDKESGSLVTLNDLSNMEFEVYADIGPSYSTQREQTVEQLGGMVAAMPPGDPMRQALMLKQLVLMQGVEFDDIRDYANKQLILQGVKEPSTDEEKAILQQAKQQQQGQQDPNMLIGQAEVMKAQVAAQKEQREQATAAANIQNQSAQTQIDVFEAQTDRQKVQVEAQKAGAEINMKRQDQLLKQVEAASKLRGSVM